MGIDAKHPSYEDMEDNWDLCSDFIDGEAEVKKAGTKYLPKLSGMTENEYRAFKNRANFFPVTSKTCAGLLGAVFYRAPEVSLPANLEYLKTSATVDGKTMTDLAIEVVKSLLEYGRVGLFVDRPTDGGKPYMVVYDGDDIVNWDVTSPDKFIVLEEETFVRDPEAVSYTHLTLPTNREV